MSSSGKASCVPEQQQNTWNQEPQYFGEFGKVWRIWNCLASVWLGSLLLPFTYFQVSVALLSVSDFSIYKLSLENGSLC